MVGDAPYSSAPSAGLGWRRIDSGRQVMDGCGGQGQRDAMMGDGHNRQTAHDEDVRGDPARAEETTPQDASILLRHKLGLPDPVEGYVERSELEQRCALLDRRLTVLHAPGGFGKTALLARCCRALRERGIAVAWLSLDEEDGPGSVAAYLALAFEQAGLATFGPDGERSEGADVRTPDVQAPDPQADSQAAYRIELLIRAIARHGAPCVLSLDEVERLRSREAVAALNVLLHRAPPNLHIGLALREQPPGLELATFALEGREATVTAGELRFSKLEVARFFEETLSRRELASVVEDSAGWPLALRIHRNARRRGEPGAGGADRTVADWIETRLWRGIPAKDREFVLDMALFDPVEPALIDEVTGAGNARRRIESVAALAGLLSTADGGPAMRLHPLVRDYCEKRRFEEDPERYRTIHRGIARALARRGRAVEALRHAAEANDAALLGRLAEGTGGVRLWLEQGLEVLRTVDRLLTEEVLSQYPRMALVRCVVLTSEGDIDGAKRVYEGMAAESAGFTRDREGGDDRALQTEHIFVRGLFHMCGCEHYGDDIMAVILSAKAVADAPDTDPLLSRMFSLGSCIAAGDDRGALGEFVLAALALKAELVERRLHHRHAGGQLLEVEEPERGAGGGREEHRRRPARASVLVAPGDATQIDGIEQQRADVDVVVSVIAGDLPGDHRFRSAWRPPDQGRLAGLDQGGEHFGELARAQRVVGGDGLGKGHWRAPDGGEAARPPSPGASRHRKLRGSLLVVLRSLWPACHAEDRRRAGACGQAPIGPVRSLCPPPATNGTPVTSGSGGRVDDRVWLMRRSSCAQRRGRCRQPWGVGADAAAGI